MDYVPLKRTR